MRVSAMARATCDVRRRTWPAILVTLRVIVAITVMSAIDMFPELQPAAAEFATDIRHRANLVHGTARTFSG